MKQLHLDFDCNFDTLILKDDYHYLVNVRRLSSSDFLYIIDKNSKKFLFQVKNIDKQKKEIMLIKKDVLLSNTNKFKIDIVISSIKTSIDDVLKMLVELGVDNIYLYNAKNSVKKLDLKKLERYQKIIKSAIEQSNTNCIANINFLQDLNQLEKKSTMVVLHHQKHQNHKRLNEILKKDTDFCFLIGPEGGWDSSEFDYFLKNDFLITHISDNILRSITSSVATISIVSYLLYEKNNYLE